jgi:ADP-heptose:LPS heptosyltransferase
MEDVPYDTIKAYLNKLLPKGKLLVHTKDSVGWKFLMYEYDNGSVILSKPWVNDLPKKNMGIMRLGAIGDLFQTASVCAAAKKQGYHVTVYAQNPSGKVLENNPNIDVLICTDREIIRNSELRLYWDWLSTQHTKFVNLCGSVEDSWLPNKDSPRFHWPANLREKHLSTNYVQFSHEMAGVPYKLDVKFYPTAEEIAWADEERKKFKESKLICWALNGSSLHKVFPWFDEFVARVMLLIPNCGVITLGDEAAKFLEQGWENEDRVHQQAGTWSIRQSLTFIQRHADLLIGPETGLLNAMCVEQLPKIIFLSHSNVMNLTRDWVKTTNIVASKEVRAECDNCCRHRLHMNDDGFTHIRRDEETGVAHCQAKLDRNLLFQTAQRVLK